jgi:hypothetical protein
VDFWNFHLAPPRGRTVLVAEAILLLQLVSMNPDGFQKLSDSVGRRTDLTMKRVVPPDEPTHDQRGRVRC